VQEARGAFKAAPYSDSVDMEQSLRGGARAMLAEPEPDDPEPSHQMRPSTKTKKMIAPHHDAMPPRPLDAGMV